MVRTQIYLPETLYDELATMAHSQQIPMARVIRETLKKGLQPTKQKRNDLLALTKLQLRGGPKDLSQRLDFYLYG